jgi:hypothetical protein
VGLIVDARVAFHNNDPHPARLRCASAGDPPRKGEGKDRTRGARMCRALTTHTLQLLFPLLITIGKQWIGAGDHFLHLQVASSHQARTLMLGSFRQNARAPPPSC